MDLGSFTSNLSVPLERLRTVLGTSVELAISGQQF